MTLQLLNECHVWPLSCIKLFQIALSLSTFKPNSVIAFKLKQLDSSKYIRSYFELWKENTVTTFNSIIRSKIRKQSNALSECKTLTIFVIILYTNLICIYRRLYQPFHHLFAIYLLTKHWKKFSSKRSQKNKKTLRLSARVMEQPKLVKLPSTWWVIEYKMNANHLNTNKLID